MTGAQLADAAGYDRSNITNWKKGGSSPRPEQVRSTAKALGVEYVEALVAAGILRDDDLGIERVCPDVTGIPDDELFAEAMRRMLAISKKSKKEKQGKK